MKKIVLLALVCALSTLSAETVKSYYPNGKLKSAEEYKNGKRTGMSHEYYEDGATLRTAKPYLGGKLHGIVQAYSSNALLRYEVPYKNGLENGTARYYTDDGLLKAEVDYKDGLKDGRMRLYYETGMLKIETVWENGKLVDGYLFNMESKNRRFTKEEFEIFRKANE